MAQSTSLSQALQNMPTQANKTPISQQVKQNGQLLQTSTQEAQQLTGLPLTSPAQGAANGLNPDQAKMVGASAQKTSALRAAIQGQNDLGTRQREQQASSTGTATDQSEIEKAKQAQGLGSLASRVQQIATQQLQQGLTPTGPLNAASIDTSRITDPNLRAAADALKQNPNDQQSLVNLSQALGKQPGEPLTQDDINTLYGGTAGVAGLAGNAAAANTANNVTVGTLPAEIQDAAAGLLGPDSKGLTVSQLLDRIKQEQTAEFHKTSTLTNKLTNPFIGAAERAEARSQLRDAGASGVASAEGSIDKLADQIQNADTVTFNGQKMDVEHLLNDDMVSGVVANYLQDPTSVESQQLEKNEPDLVNLIKQYKPMMEQAVNSLGSGVAEFSSIQYDNKHISDVDLGNGQTTTIDPSIMQQLVPNYGTTQAGRIDPNSSGVLSYLRDFSKDPTTRQSVLSTLNTLNQINPDMVKQISSWTPAQVQSNLVNNPNAKSLIQQASLINKMDPAHVNADQVAQAYGFQSDKDMQAQVSDANSKQKSGLFGTSNLAGSGIVLGPQGLLDYTTMINRLKAQTPQDLNVLLAPGNKSAADKTKQVVTDYASTANSSNNVSLFNKIQDAYDSRGEISGPSLQKVLPNLSVDDMSHLIDSPAFNHLAGSAKAIVTQRHDQIMGQKVDDTINSASNSTYPSLSSMLQATARPAMTEQEQQHTTDALQSAITSLQDMSRSNAANGDKSNENYLDHNIATLQSTLDKYNSSSTANVARQSEISKSVNNDVNSILEKYAGKGTTLNELVNNLNTGNVSEDGLNIANKSLALMQVASRNARASGDTDMMNQYDQQIGTLQDAINNTPSQEGGRTSGGSTATGQVAAAGHSILSGLGGAVSDLGKTTANNLSSGLNRISGKR